MGTRFETATGAATSINKATFPGTAEGNVGLPGAAVNVGTKLASAISECVWSPVAHACVAEM